MHLTAVYFHRHFLFNDASFNLGGEHFYDFSLKDKVLTVNRTVNSKYVDKFFAEGSPNLTLVSAIVGSNGSGKTTLLKEIIAGVIESRYSANILLVFENPDKSVCWFNDTKFQIQCEGFASDECAYKIETVYYAPFFEGSKFYHDYEPTNIDISTDRLLYFDRDSNKSRERSDPILEHWYQNTYRRFAFLGTTFAKNLYRHFNIPSIEKASLKFRGPDYFPKKSEPKNENAITYFNNTPTNFEPVINKLLKIWDKELDLHRGKRNPVTAKLWFLRKLMSSIFAPLEADGQFLSRGRVLLELNDLDGLTLKNALENFLDNHSFVQSESNRPPNAALPTQKIKDLIKIAFEVIDSPETGFEDDREIEVSFENAKKILEAEKAFLNGMSIFDKAPAGFIDAEPNIELSTGEKALLDLFSRFYFGIDEIEKKKTDEYSENFPNHFILLLDEGDMTFHPIWLKKYVHRIVDVLPKMFEENFKDSAIQIILTTHSPFILSDLPKENVIFLKKGEDGNCQVLDGLNDMKQTFGANIHTLLSDGFFMDGLMGDFAKEKIDKVIRFLNNELKQGETMTDKEAEKIIQMIGEPILKRHLQQQFLYLKQKDELKVLKDEMAELKKQINQQP